jgi:hypothetical protein
VIRPTVFSRGLLHCARDAAKTSGMLYALLAYHDEKAVQDWSESEDNSLMEDLNRVHERLTREGRLGPAARLGATSTAVTVRSKALVLDGPFAETKEALLGLYLLDCANIDEAVKTAQQLKAANPSAVYEVRPVVLYLPGAPIEKAQAGLDLVRPPAK